MVYEKKQLLLAFVLAVLAGAGLHFVYGLCPNGVTALFSPVNESIWEHVKILFWPYLAAAVWLTWGRPTALRPWLLIGVGICLAMLGVGYFLHVVLGWNSLAADLVLLVPFFKNMMHRNYQYLYGGVEQHLLGK